MSKRKISELSSATEVNPSDSFEVVQNGQNKKVTKQTASTIPLKTFATALTFDEDKELATVNGGTTTFTLSGSGNVNGIGILVKINEPVAVNFPAGFESISGSDSISGSHMNIIVFRYFSDYDGSGNAKVLYFIKNQTAI